MRYRTTIAATGAATTGIPVPADILDALAAGRAPKVRVTIRGHTYRSSIGTVDGEPMISLSAENRAAAGVAGGDEVDVEVELDTEKRAVVVPDDLAAAFAAEPAARRTWDALSFSNQRYWELQLAGAKTPETRRRRIDKAIATLREGRPR